MILAALLIQAAAPQTALDAERAFNAAAQAKGQWTAFREFAAEDATMFVPQPVKARKWLKGRKDPAKSVEWWPTESYVSCDGNAAINKGGWKRPDGATGYFLTVWLREPDGRFKWHVDGGDALDAPLPVPAKPSIIRPDCATEARQFIPPYPGESAGGGVARDATLAWKWRVAPDGSRHFEVRQWNGKYLASTLEHDVAAPAR